MNFPVNNSTHRVRSCSDWRFLSYCDYQPVGCTHDKELEAANKAGDMGPKSVIYSCTWGAAWEEPVAATSSIVSTTLLPSSCRGHVSWNSMLTSLVE